jgi:hypothetical protein
MAHDQEVVGSNPGTRILDGCKRFASYYSKEKWKIKVAKWCTPKNYLKKLYIFIDILFKNKKAIVYNSGSQSWVCTPLGVCNCLGGYAECPI